MKFKQVRLSKNITAVDLARKVGFTKSQMSDIENYKLLPTPQKLNEICKILKCHRFDIYNKDQLDFAQAEKARERKQELLFGQPIKKVQFRLSLGSSNLLELAKKEFGQASLHELYRNIIEPMLIRAIKQEQTKKQKQKLVVMKMTTPVVKRA